MEQAIASKRYNEAIKMIHNYIECTYASQEQKDELASLYKKLIDKEDPIEIYDKVHHLTYSIWYQGYIEHERNYMCIIL
jgi:hypothetical protein